VEDEDEDEEEEEEKEEEEEEEVRDDTPSSARRSASENPEEDLGAAGADGVAPAAAGATANLESGSAPSSSLVMLVEGRELMTGVGFWILVDFLSPPALDSTPMNCLE
jgi:hypothetical protein